VCDGPRRRPVRAGRAVGLGLVLELVLGLVLGLGRGASCHADERVQITATDGVQLVGHLAGDAGPGIVFGHMYPADQRSWTAFAREMAAAGFRTLTFDFRGYGESGGRKDIAAIDRDMEGAYRLLIGRKVRPVYLVGASMGGTAALLVAARVPVAGVATLSAPLAFRGLDATPALSKVTCRKLFIAAEGDTRAADAAKRLADATPGAKTLDLVPGADHGTVLLEGPEGAAVGRAIRAFLTGAGPP
jgi:pimeloyl-ACP methyl ester carboxylesterase